MSSRLLLNQQTRNSGAATAWVNFKGLTFFSVRIDSWLCKSFFSGFAKLAFLKTMNEVAFLPIWFKAHDLKIFFIVSGLISSYASRIQFTIVRRGRGFKFPAGVNCLIPILSSHWSYFPLQQLERYSQGKTVFYSIQYKNDCLTASELFIYLHNQLSSTHSVVTF